MYIVKLAMTYFFKKKKRSILMIFAMIISTTICVSSLLLMESVINIDFENEDKFHYAFYSQENVNLPPNYEVTVDENTGMYSFYNEQLVNYRYFKEYNNDLTPIKLVEGRYPENPFEIMVSDNLGITLNSKLVLNDFYSDDTQSNQNLYKTNLDVTLGVENTYTVVGIYRQTQQMEAMHTNIELFYLMDMDHSVSRVYYAYDKNIQLNMPFDYASNVVTNDNAITNDKLSYYLRNIQMIIPVFIGIVMLCIYISFNTIQNILVATDSERKKEIGLLKSIGIRPLQLLEFLIIDILLIGIIGISLGAYFGILVYKMIVFSTEIFIENINIWFILLSILINTCVLSTVQYITFSPLFKTNSIDDLREIQSFEKINHKSSSKKSSDFSWEMFLTYNYRMRKQRKSIFKSFFLLLLCTSVFSSLFFSMIIFSNQYDTGVDFVIRGTEYDMSIMNTIRSYEDLYTYDVQRVFNGLGKCYIEVNESTKGLGDLCEREKIGGVEYYNLNMNTVGLDSTQISSFYKGECGSNEVLLVYVHENLNAKKIVDTVNEKGYIIINDEQFTINSVCVISDNLNENTIFCVLPIEAWQQERGFKYYFETINITLLSDLNAYYVEEILTEIIEKAPTNNMEKQDPKYELTSLIGVKSDNAIYTFILKICLYPLFMMLFIISILNLYQVVQSNIYMKHNDIRIFKAVGIKPSQLILLFAFEYLEGYINAAILISGIMLLVSIGLYNIDFLEAFAFSEHLFASQILAVGFLGVILSLPVILISFIQINKGGVKS